MKIERFEDINGWQLARELVREVYACTEIGDFSRDFGLRDQIRRAAGSVMHNIAEGFDAGSDIEFTRFLRYSQRSCTEVQSELYVAFDQKYLNEQQFNYLYELAKHTHSKIGGFIKYLKTSSPSPLKTTKDQGPRTKDQGPRTKNQGPRTKNQEPRTKNQGPRTKDQGPRTKDQEN